MRRARVCHTHRTVRAHLPVCRRVAHPWHALQGIEALRLRLLQGMRGIRPHRETPHGADAETAAVCPLLAALPFLVSRFSGAPAMLKPARRMVKLLTLLSSPCHNNRSNNLSRTEPT